ncbi:uncharacterized protein C8Q71DRAFT_309651 [Rhodofomes roseus]|uniref:Secreted protein n=1 Tax=Rhodofomes roseus TaxID=34475 RepID=A0ABQ8K4A6_9APHY|nr:uncharacterized protein C8Q71DRAFT_309651 [Rhodofomes roseus]KAH9831206.1 hypothetical protein C8Q71DRAFT_309651 [Rhodofomes roseus]
MGNLVILFLGCRGASAVSVDSPLERARAIDTTLSCLQGSDDEDVVGNVSTNGPPVCTTQGNRCPGLSRGISYRACGGRARGGYIARHLSRRAYVRNASSCLNIGEFERRGRDWRGPRCGFPSEDGHASEGAGVRACLW